MMDKDYIMYIVLFALISIGAYRSGVQKETLENRIKNTENTLLTLTVKKKQLEHRVNALEMRVDSVYLHITK